MPCPLFGGLGDQRPRPRRHAGAGEPDERDDAAGLVLEPAPPRDVAREAVARARLAGRPAPGERGLAPRITRRRAAGRADPRAADRFEGLVAHRWKQLHREYPSVEAEVHAALDVGGVGDELHTRRRHSADRLRAPVSVILVNRAQDREYDDHHPGEHDEHDEDERSDAGHGSREGSGSRRYRTPPERATRRPPCACARPTSRGSRRGRARRLRPRRPDTAPSSAAGPTRTAPSADGVRGSGAVPITGGLCRAVTRGHRRRCRFPSASRRLGAPGLGCWLSSTGGFRWNGRRSGPGRVRSQSDPTQMHKPTAHAKRRANTRPF